MKPVWIVDDDRSIRWVFEKALGREGIAFNSFASASEALDALSNGPPQVLVSDIRMPGPSGLQLLQTVKARYPTVPVIVMTAYSDLESAVAAFQGGAYEYLPDSVSKFPDQKNLVKLMELTGFDDIEYKNLTGGIAAIHFGAKK